MKSLSTSTVPRWMRKEEDYSRADENGDVLKRMENSDTSITYNMEDDLSDENLGAIRQKFSSKAFDEAEEDDEAEGEDEKKVRFGDLTLREYPITLGDNPGCRVGPPITIQWDHVKEQIIPVDVWEEQRELHRLHRDFNSGEGRDCPRIPTSERREMLQPYFSSLEIFTRSREVRDVHQKRLETISRQRYEQVEVLAESIFRKAKRLFSREPSPSCAPVARSSCSSGSVEPHNPREQFKKSYSLNDISPSNRSMKLGDRRRLGRKSLSFR